MNQEPKQRHIPAPGAIRLLKSLSTSEDSPSFSSAHVGKPSFCVWQSFPLRARPSRGPNGGVKALPVRYISRKRGLQAWSGVVWMFVESCGMGLWFHQEARGADAWGCRAGSGPVTPAAGAARCLRSLRSFLLCGFGGVTLPRGDSPRLGSVVDRRRSQNCVLRSTRQPTGEVCCVVGAEVPWGSQQTTHRPRPRAQTQSGSSPAKALPS